MKSQQIKQHGDEGVYTVGFKSEQFYRFITTKIELSGFLIDSAFLQGGTWNIRIKGFSETLGRDDRIKEPCLMRTLKLWGHVSLYIRAPRILSVFQSKESSPVAFPALWLTWIQVKSNRPAPLTNTWSLEKSLLTSSWRCC